MQLSKQFTRWLAVIALAVSTAARAVVPAPEYVEGEALVRFQASQTLASAKQAAARHGLTLARHYAWLSEHEGQVIGLLRSPDLTTAALMEELRAEPAIALAEPNFLCHVTDLRPPNDARFNFLWALRNTGQSVNGFPGTPNDDISFLKAWGLARPTTDEIVVGVIDSGIDPTHPDLVSNLWTNPAEIPGNGIDDDGNGYTDDVHGYNFYLSTATLTDSGYHGTHVAGTVAATGNNGRGILGVDFRAHLMVLKASINDTDLSIAATIAATQYAAMMKSRGVNIVVLNASYGRTGNYSFTEQTAIQAAGDVGIIFCAAAGNDSTDNDTTPSYPASLHLPNMITVAATDQNDALADFSNYGATTVDLAAPGVNVLSCSPVALPGYSTYVQTGTNVLSAQALTYSGDTPPNGIAGTIYYCGLGYPADFPAAVRNNLALIQRGTLFFSEKVANAMTAGARAAIIFNNVAGGFSGTLQSPGDWIPALSIPQADGQTLQATLPAVGTVVNFADPAQPYRLLDGTSMAAPHVAGAVAFAARNSPLDSVQQRIQRILANATPVPALAGLTVTGARLDLARLVDSDNNGLPDWWEELYFGVPTGIDPAGDADGDGMTNAAEFGAGTDPLVPSSRLAVTAFGVGPGSFSISFPTVVGKVYAVEYSENLAAWSVLTSGIAGTGGDSEFIDSSTGGTAQRFYRVRVE